MTDTTQFNKGVQILLERIKSNPEEFTNLDALSPAKTRTRWGHIIRGVCNRIHYPASKDIELPYLSDKEVAAMYEALKPLLAQQFTEQVMKELLPSDSSSQLDMWQTSNNGLVVTGTLEATGRIMGSLLKEKP